MNVLASRDKTKYLIRISKSKKKITILKKTAQSEKRLRKKYKMKKKKLTSGITIQEIVPEYTEENRINTKKIIPEISTKKKIPEI